MRKTRVERQQQDFSDEALILFAHGSSVDEGAGAPVHQHVLELRRHGRFAEVHGAFWKQDPRLASVIEFVRSPRVLLVPLFMSEGYFSAQVIPRELGFAPGIGAGRPPLSRSGKTLFYCAPVGTHSGMSELVRARALEVLEQFPFPRRPSLQETTLFIAGHGTRQEANSRQAIERQVAWARETKLFAAVEGVYLEEEPRISECCRLASTRHLVVVPFFMGEGPHTKRELPLLLGESPRVIEQRLSAGQPAWRNPTERQGKLIWYAASVGTHPRVAHIILARAEEMVQKKSPVRSAEGAGNLLFSDDQNL